MKRSYIVLIVLAVLLFPITCYFYTTTCNVASAPARVINKTLETNNIITNYEWFYDARHFLKARVNQIKQYKGFLKDETDRDEIRKLRMELAAMQQACRDLAEKYNSNSRKLNRKVFKSKDLPYQLNINVCE